MTLEDFFTLTEMKDGLTAVGRVEELVSMMKKNSDSSTKNIAETARQWSTVASTLAATENLECLELFIHLDGLYFLNKWLQEAEKSSNDEADTSVDESISLLLGALKKLPIDNERVSSGIGETVGKLFEHRSSIIQERARDLFDGWKQRDGNDSDNQDNMEEGECHQDGVEQADVTVTVNNGCQEQSSIDVSPVKESDNDDRPIMNPNGNEFQHSRGSDSTQTECVKDGNLSVCKTHDNSHTTPSKVDKEDGFGEDAQVSTFMPNPFQESHSIIDESPACTAEGTVSMGVCSSPAPGNEKSLDVPNLKDLSSGVKESPIRKDIAGENGEVELCSLSTSSKPDPGSSIDPANVQKPVTQPALLSNVDAQDSMDMAATDFKGEEVGSETVKHLRCPSETGGCYSENSSIDGCILRKPEDLETSLSRKEDNEAVDDVNALSDDSVLKVEGEKDNATTGTSMQSVVVSRISETNRESDMDLEYGVDDALEVARQLAKEIEQEVVDYREPFCSSSSEKNPECGLEQPSSPYSINTEQDQPVTCPENQLPIGQNLTDGASLPNKEDQLMVSENLDKPEDHMHGTGSSLVTEALQKPADTPKMGLCDFDLNEVCSEDTDLPSIPVSAPITMVSASKKAARNSPPSPPRFMGELGWKGSAATSAFRPAPGFKTSDGERTFSVEGSSQSSRPTRLFNIDLNVAEGYGDAADGGANPVLETQIPVSSGFPSGESSIEVSSRRAERLKLDLNRAIDTDDGPIEGQVAYQPQNSSPSPASSSSSRHPPSLRNFDLNGPFFDDYTGLGRSSSVDLHGYGGYKADEGVISILGSKVQVKGKEPVTQTLPFLQNAVVPEQPAGGVFTRPDSGFSLHPPGAYMPPPSSAYGYSHLAAGSSMPLPSAFYGSGSVPGAVDTRGVPMMPNMMMGTQGELLPSYNQGPYFMSMNGPMMGMNGAGPVRPYFDLNSGFTMENDNRGQPGSSRHAYNPGQAYSSGQAMLMSQQMMNPEAQSSKRNEPDGGWDLFPPNTRRQPPWN